MLLAEGHIDAYNYPVWLLHMEHEITVERINNRVVSDAIVLQSAMSGLLSKAGSKNFNALVKKVLNNGG